MLRKCVLRTEIDWIEVKNGAFCIFFFFLISAWIGGFTRYRPIRPELARIAPIQRKSPESGNEKKKDGRGTDSRAAASLARHRVGQRRTRVQWPFCHVRASQVLLCLIFLIFVSSSLWFCLYSLVQWVYHCKYNLLFLSMKLRLTIKKKIIYWFRPISMMLKPPVL